MKLYRKARRLALAAAAGATTAYLLDPDKGPRRRQHLTTTLQRAIGVPEPPDEQRSVITSPNPLPAIPHA